jgi:hypothetical protein
MTIPQMNYTLGMATEERRHHLLFPSAVPAASGSKGIISVRFSRTPLKWMAIYENIQMAMTFLKMTGWEGREIAFRFLRLGKNKRFYFK